MSKFKCGDTVMVRLYSWSRYLNGSGPNTPPFRVEAEDGFANPRKFTVLAVDCKIPVKVSNRRGADGYLYANTLIREVGSSAIAAINDCNLFSDAHTTIRFISNDTDVTDVLSKQSKQAILKANLKGNI